MPIFRRREVQLGLCKLLRLVNPAGRSRRASGEDAADGAGFVPVPSCSLCPFVCFLPRHLDY